MDAMTGKRLSVTENGLSSLNRFTKHNQHHLHPWMMTPAQQVDANHFASIHRMNIDHFFSIQWDTSHLICDNSWASMFEEETCTPKAGYAFAEHALVSVMYFYAGELTTQHEFLNARIYIWRNYASKILVHHYNSTPQPQNRKHPLHKTQGQQKPGIEIFGCNFIHHTFLKLNPAIIWNTCMYRNYADRKCVWNNQLSTFTVTLSLLFSAESFAPFKRATSSALSIPFESWRIEASLPFVCFFEFK